MILKDEQGNEYEFEKFMPKDVSLDGNEYGFLKPVDSWPKEGDEYWLINADGDVGHIEQNRYGLDENDKFLGVYRTKQEAELAADRIKSLQEASEVYTDIYYKGGIEETNEIEVTLRLPKKYLKAWKELSDE